MASKMILEHPTTFMEYFGLASLVSQYHNELCPKYSRVFSRSFPSMHHIHNRYATGTL